MSEHNVTILPQTPLAKQEKPDVQAVLIRALREAGMDEDLVATELLDVIKHAEVMNSKWDTITDYATKHQALKTLIRLLTQQPENQINIAAIFAWNNTL